MMTNIIYETKIVISVPYINYTIRMLNRMKNNPNRKTDFDFDVRDNILVLKTKTDNDGYMLSKWLRRSNALKNKIDPMDHMDHYIATEKIYV